MRKSLLKQRPRLLLLAVLIFINLFFLTFLVSGYTQNNGNEEFYPEVVSLNGTEDFDYLKNYFTALAEEKGGEYAFEVLKRAKIKPNTDMHLMGHYVGEILYKQKGAEGMEYCTQDFRNACSHTIVVGLFTDKGVEALPEIIKGCEKAPGGKGAYNMCFHGLGHGVLAYTGYNLEKAVELCSKTDTDRKDGREFPECVGGAVMEIISGGDHDKELWTAQSEKYLTTGDPLYPCNNPIIPDEVKTFCYIYLTPHLWNYVGAAPGSPTSEDFRDAFAYCADVEKEEHRKACYGGFGKEFVVLAKDRDIRNVSEMTDEQLEKIRNWCMVADSRFGQEQCTFYALGSMYWGGENTYNSSVKFCNLFANTTISCFDELMNIIKTFNYDNQAYMRTFCSDLPQTLQAKCEDEIL